MGVPQRSVAVSNRSHCKICLDLIDAGTDRIGVEAFLAGRMATAWMHPACFFGKIYVERADANRGKCRITEQSFKKGDPRVVVPTGPSKFFATLSPGGSMLAGLLKEEDEFSLADITGIDVLKSDERETFLGAPAGAQASKRAKVEKKDGAAAAAAAPAPGSASPAPVEWLATATPAADPATRRKQSRRGAAKEPAADNAEAAAAATAGGDDAAPTAAKSSGLTAFELEREQQIRRNRERLLALNLPGLADEFVASKPPAAAPARPRGITARKVRDPAERPPPRKSLRSLGMAPDGSLAQGIDYEKRNGSVVLADKGSAMPWLDKAADKPKGKPQCPMPFVSANGKPESDAEFLELLKASGPELRTPSKEDEEMITVSSRIRAGKESAAKGAKGKGKAQAAPAGAVAQAPRAVGGAAQLVTLSLAENAVAKVVPRGAVHVDWNPRSDSLVVATGDKDGHVGIWRVEGGCSTSAPSGSAAKGAAAAGGGGGDAEEEDDDDDNGANDGVFLFKPHAQYICGLKWAQTGAPRLLSGSYDGSIRCLDAGAGQWTELFSGDDELSAFDCDAACGMAFVGGPDGDLRSIDLRSGKAASPAVSAHSRRVNCVHMDPVGGNLVATAAGDSLVCVFDIRKFGKGAKPVNKLTHGKTCQSAYFAPAGETRLVTTSYDDMLRIWSGVGSAGECSALTIKHNNQTGRWVSPFRAIWAPAGDAIVCGSLKRATEVIGAATGKVVASFTSELMTAIPPRHACHPLLPAICAASGSGRLHIWRC